MRAAIYCRISLDQTGEGLGVTRQREDCEDLARQLGWEVAEVYTDNDISATTGKVRPAYQQLLAGINAGLYDAIIVWHVDRLYRRMVDLTYLLEVVQKNKTAIATVKAGMFDLSSPTGQLLAEIMASVATYEGKQKSERWKRSVRQRREAGTFAPSGPRMYGYTRDGEIVDTEADAIRWMVREVNRGASLNGLARECHKRGLTSTNGRPLSVQSIKVLLTNPKLVGMATLNGDVIGLGQWQPILQRDEWETVCAVIAAAPRRGVQPRVALLPGLIWCGRCGAKMVTGSRMNKAGGTVRTYRCTRVPGADACGAVSGAADPLEEVVEAYAKARLADPRVRKRIAELAVHPSALLAEIAETEQRIIELEASLDQPGVPVETLLRSIGRAKERLTELHVQLGQATPAALPNRGEWPADLARRRALVNQVVERVWLDPKREEGPRHEFDPERVRIDPR